MIKVFEDKISTDERRTDGTDSRICGGDGNLESTCGALIGAVMTAGV
ncbi:MAG: hypothetical protein ACLVAT_07160 [Lachnospiraceae bacterium]